VTRPQTRNPSGLLRCPISPHYTLEVVQKQLPSSGRKTNAQSADLFSDKALVGFLDPMTDQKPI
jgi:hypothetical protein